MEYKEFRNVYCRVAYYKSRGFRIYRPEQPHLLLEVKELMLVWGSVKEAHLDRWNNRTDQWVLNVNYQNGSNECFIIARG